MIRLFTLLPFVLCLLSCHAQDVSKLVMTGEYTSSDSLQATLAYLRAKEATQLMQQGMDAIWNTKPSDGQSPREARLESWKKNQAFVKWLGEPDKVNAVRRKINRIYSRFQKKVILDVTKENKGRCTGWISAWTIPFGKSRIRLCEDYFVYRTHLQEKVLVHEMGHEAGMLFHRKIHGCRAARRAATFNNNTAKRSTENYAWLAMSYLGQECSGR